MRDTHAEEQVSTRGDDTNGTNSVACFAVDAGGRLSLEAIVDSGVRCAVEWPSRPNRVRVCSLGLAWGYPAWAYPTWALY